MEQIVPYIKFIFIWETFLNDWQCLVLQQSNQVFIWSSVAKANSYPQGKQKVFLSEKKKKYLTDANIHSNTGGRKLFQEILSP